MEVRPEAKQREVMKLVDMVLLEDKHLAAVDRGPMQTRDMKEKGNVRGEVKKGQFE